MLDFKSMDTVQYDKALNEIANGVFTSNSETDKRQVQIMLWGLCNLLLEKGYFSQKEFTDAMESATTFFNLLKRRYNIQNPDDTDDSTENA